MPDLSYKKGPKKTGSSIKNGEEGEKSESVQVRGLAWERVTRVSEGRKLLLQLSGRCGDLARR